MDVVFFPIPKYKIINVFNTGDFLTDKKAGIKLLLLQTTLPKLIHHVLLERTWTLKETIERIFQFQIFLTSILGKLFKFSWYFNVYLLVLRDICMDKCSGNTTLLVLQTQ